MIAQGKYPFRAVPGEFDFREAGEKKTPYVAVLCRVEGTTDQQITWKGWLTEKSAQRTMASLRLMGWDGKNLKTLDGLGSLPFQGEVQHETRDGRTFAELAWVNPPSGPVREVKNRMDADRVAELALQYGAAGSSNDDIPF